MRERLEKDINGAMGTLVLAKAILGEEVLRSFSFASKRDISLDMTVENIWGLGVPKIETKDLRRRMDERGVSAIGESPMDYGCGEKVRGGGDGDYRYCLQGDEAQDAWVRRLK